ncbi:MAG TPA: RDD family protein [Vicinamibacterales bacterium]|nr:RDD family protein [Vicinamibacterales bacterium]
MKCPKCSYLSFEAGERCRNCGYDFSMSAPPADDPAGDLPLFEDDRPLVSVPASPRPPLSVRRTGPRPHLGAGGQDPARLRSRHAPAAPSPPAELDLEFDAEPPAWDAAMDETPARAGAPAASAAAAFVDPRHPAPVLRRLAAAVIDLALIGGIDAAVIYFTLQLAGLDVAEFFVLPIVPLAAFLLLLNAGYLVMFTAATGQTIGKMAAGIRVVGTAPADVLHDRVTFGRAVLRTAGYFASLLPAGLGFLPAFIGPRDHRALHDRLAETRVVRA